MTNQEYVNVFLTYQYSRNLSKKTMEWYEYVTQKFLGYLEEKGKAIETMKLHDARQWVVDLQNDERNYKGNTVNVHIRAIKAMFNYFVEDEYLEKSPFKKVGQIKVDKVIIPTFTSDEVRNMLKQLNKRKYSDLRDGVIIMLMYDCGLRISEATGIKTIDVDMGKNLIKVFGKGHKERLVPFGRQVKKELLRFNSRRATILPKDMDTGLLFCTRFGTEVTERNMLRKIQLIGKAAGVENKRLSPHTFRHSFAKQYLMQGGDLFSLQQIMGHSSLVSTRKYINLLTEDIQKKHRMFSPLDNI